MEAEQLQGRKGLGITTQLDGGASLGRLSLETSSSSEAGSRLPLSSRAWKLMVAVVRAMEGKSSKPERRCQTGGQIQLSQEVWRDGHPDPA